MRAVGYFAPGPITAPDSLRDIELPRPSATGRDLLVEVRAISVNPVDTKVRASAPAPAGAAQGDRLGCGRRRCRGGAAGLAVPGRRRGVLCRQHRAVGHQRAVPSDRRAHCRPQAALARLCRKPRRCRSPRITAWEALFDRMDIRRPVPGAAPGGAHRRGRRRRRLDCDPAGAGATDLTVVATASRPETMAWVKELGAHHVVDHRKPIAAEVAASGSARRASCSLSPTRRTTSRTSSS